LKVNVLIYSWFVVNETKKIFRSTKFWVQTFKNETRMFFANIQTNNKKLNILVHLNFRTKQKLKQFLQNSIEWKQNKEMNKKQLKK
jgi:hypothetical protein